MDQDRWQRLSEAPLVVAALVYLLAYSLQVLLPAPPIVAGLLAAVVWIVWGVFLVDYAVRLALAEDRRRWFVRHLFDLLTVALPFLRPLRLLQLVRSAAILSKSRAAQARGGAVVFAVAGAAFVVYVGSLAVYSAERSAPGADIRSFGDAVWWSVTTVTTVGYGDYAPVTVAGRVIATGIMLVGIALIGAVTASLASYVAQQAAQVQAAPPHRHQTTEALHEEIADLKRQLARSTSTTGEGAGPGS